MRGTILISSRAVLAASGLFAKYEARLPESERTTLREIVAGSWVPFPTSVAHYEACEALGLSAKEQFDLGQKTGARVNGTLLGTIGRLARSVGVTPWTLIDQLPRFWSRGFDGGAITCERLGPKDARVTVADQPLLQFRYFRQGLAGTADAQLRPFCARPSLQVESFAARAATATYRYQWA